MRQKAFLRFPPEKLGLPATTRLIRDFNLSINILRAEVAAARVGELVIDIDGNADDISAAMRYLADQGITAQALESAVVWDGERCVDCGACTAVCPSGALALDRTTWELKFSPAQCLACELCARACPLRAMTSILNPELAPA